MTIRELKELIKDIPDDADVYVGDNDCGDDVDAYDVYYALQDKSFQYRHSVKDKSKVVAIEITGLF